MLFYQLLASIIVLLVDTERANSKDTRVPEADVMCLMFKCALPMATCGFSSQCRQCLDCMQNTCHHPTMDPSYAACTTTCFFKYSDDAFLGLTKCGLEHGCLTPMRWTDTKCAVDARDDLSAYIPSQIKQFDVKELSDVSHPWVVSHGSNKVFDCFDCQTLDFTAPTSTSTTTNTVDVMWESRLEQGLWRSAEYQLHSLNNATHSSVRLWAKYWLFGADLEEHYFILDRTADFILYTYCGYGAGGEYQGSQVYARPGAQMDLVTLARFQVAIQKARAKGVDLPNLSSYCTPNSGTVDCQRKSNLLTLQ